jgi:hypothetical protein
MMARAGLMRTVLLALALALSARAGTAAAEPSRGKAAAARKANAARRARPVQPRRPAPAREATSVAVVAERSEPEAAPAAAPAPAPAAGPRPGKPRVYTFGGLDVEGKLKAPQLLYFRSRMRQELDTSNAETRSFLKELEKTADEEGL